MEERTIDAAPVTHRYFMRVTRSLLPPVTSNEEPPGARTESPLWVGKFGTSWQFCEVWRPARNVIFATSLDWYIYMVPYIYGTSSDRYICNQLGSAVNGNSLDRYIWHKLGSIYYMAPAWIDIYGTSSAPHMAAVKPELRLFRCGWQPCFLEQWPRWICLIVFFSFNPNCRFTLCCPVSNVGIFRQKWRNDSQ